MGNVTRGRNEFPALQMFSVRQTKPVLKPLIATRTLTLLLLLPAPHTKNRDRNVAFGEEAHNRVPRVNSESNCFMQNCCAAACGWGGGLRLSGELHFLVDRLGALEHQIWNTFCGCADGE